MDNAKHRAKSKNKKEQNKQDEHVRSPITDSPDLRGSQSPSLRQRGEVSEDEDIYFKHEYDYKQAEELSEWGLQGTPLYWLYKPHTLTGLLIASLVIVYYAFLRPVGDDMAGEIKSGLTVLWIIFLLYCVVQLRDGLIQRPHPALWRLVHGISLSYLLFLVYLLVQSEVNARHAIGFFYPELGFPPTANSKLYAEDCRLYTPEHPSGMFAHWVDVWFDIFVIAHALGWWAKAVMLRDKRLCWILAILWELLEYSFQHILPNFHECWWDHWLVDLFMCNFAGIVAGLLTCRYFEIVRYDWTGSSTGLSFVTRTKRVLKQFSPYEWTKYEWEIFSSFKRFCAALFIVVVMEVMEMNHFFLKYVLWIPPSHPLNTYRLTLLWLLGLPALREWYQYITKKGANRLGKDMWLLLAIMAAEWTVCLKFGWKLFKAPPPAVTYSWIIFLALLTLWVLLRFDILPVYSVPKSPKGKNRKRIFLNVLLVASVLPLCYLVYTQDVGYGTVGREILARQHNATLSANASLHQDL